MGRVGEVGLNGLKFSRGLLERIKELDAMPLHRVEEVARGMGVAVEYEDLGNGVFLVKDRLPSGYFRPSYLTAYFHCARRMWLKRRHGDLVTREGLRALLRGRIVHVLWQQEHPEFDVEIELLDEEDKVHGYVDALLVDGGRAVLVELKTSHKVTLGHRLQVMLYTRTVRRLLGVRWVDAYVVYRYGVEPVSYSGDLLDRYVRRVKAVLEAEEPPPVLPRELSGRCEECPYRFLCARYPRGSWNEWLLSIGDYPISEERCRGCPHLRYCRAFKARTGEYPCESKQLLL